MAVLTSQALHEQLSAIMGALTRAAVAEICGLLEEGYAALQGEISRKHRENENLRKKLHLIESIVVPGSGGGKAAVTPVVVPEVATTTEDDQQAETAQQQQRSDRDGGDGGGVAVVREEFPDVVLIKDEDSDSNDTFEEDNKMPADGGTSRELATATRHWPESEDVDRKSSPEPIAARAPAPQENGVTVYSLDSPRSEPGCSSQLGTDDMEAGESVCSYTPQMDPDVQLVHQDCSMVPPSASRPTYFGSSMASPTNREQDLSLTWTKQSKSQMNFNQFHQNENPDNDAFGLKMVSVSGSIATDSQLSESSCSAFEYNDGCDVMSFAHYRNQPGRAQICGELPGARGRRFVCGVCTKTYATSQNLEVHMRIHTGERPFTCSQCGKKFTQSAHLKSHLSVHTGERPYTCTICSKSFIVKYSLKLHMKKYHENA